MHGFEAIGVGLGFVVPYTPKRVEVYRRGYCQPKAEGEDEEDSKHSQI